MLTASASQIASQLDKLAQKGALFIRHAAIKNTRQRALNVACLSLWFLPVLCAALLLCNVRASITVLSLIIGGLVIIPIASYLAVLSWVAIKTKVTRQQTLALFDSQLGFKDDLQLVDEFRLKTSPTAFEEAALVTCYASVVKANQHTLVPSVVKPNVLSKKQILQCSLALLIVTTICFFTLLRDNSVVESIAPKHEQDALPANTEPANTSLPEPSLDNSKITDQFSEDNTANLVAHNTQSTKQAKSATELQTAAAVTNSATNAPAPVSPMSTAETGPENKNTRQSQARPKPQLASITESSEAEKAQAGEQADSAQSGQAAEGKQPEDNQTKENSSQSKSNDSTQQNEQQKSGEIPPTAPTAQQAQRQPKKSQESSKKSEQQQSSGSQQNSESQNSNNRGDDAQKKSRGINQLMLSVPMEDQFIGTPGPGVEKSTTEKLPSEEKPFEPTTSESRGENIQLPVMQQKPITHNWEKQLMKDFFKQPQQNENANDSKRNDE